MNANFTSPAAGIDNDLTPEEQEIVQRVQNENDERKKRLHEQ